MSQIGLFGGSFDPIHKAHIYIAMLAYEQLHLDEVQLIPTKNNPWKDGSRASQEDRLEMIKLGIVDCKHISINTIELESQNDDKNFTIETIERLIELHPEHHYYYIMGMDQANLFYKWKDAQKISELVTLVTFQRGHYLPHHKELEPFHFMILDNQPITASSSDARNGQVELLDSRVLKYITSQGIYLDSITSAYMKEKRWKHTMSVAKLAAEIARSNKLNEKQAYIAGMFHDIAKEMNYNEAQQIMDEYFHQYVNKPVAIWHQWVSRYMSEHKFLIDDLIILEAIEHHTTGSIHMSAIGKCVYVADKLDPLRGYDSSQQIEICKNDIHQGFRDSLIDFYEFSTKNHRDIDDMFDEIYDYFVVKGEI